MGNLIERLKKVKVKKFYEITCKEYQEILKYTDSKLINSMYYAFLFGYLKGGNAEKTKQRKQNKKNL